MATTLKAVVYADNQRKDGTYNVKIRVTHNRRSKVSTNLYVTAGGMTRGLETKKQRNYRSGRKCDPGVAQYYKSIGRRRRINVKQVVDYIKDIERNGNAFALDFIAYGRKIAKRKSKGTKSTYDTALNCFERYFNGRPLNLSKINAKFLEGFEEFIRAEPVYNYSPKHGVVKSDKSPDFGNASPYIFSQNFSSYSRAID